MPVHVCEHPFIQHHLSHMRDRSTETVAFRQHMNRISHLISVELTRNFPLTQHSIETPLATMQAPVLVDRSVVIVPILRAALGLVNGLLETFPEALCPIVAHMGLERDHVTLEPRGYYSKLPDNLAHKHIIVVDPMLATGGSMVKAISILAENGAKIEQMRIMCIVSAPEGIQKVEASYPDIPIYTAAIDERLNEVGYIVPGLGDAGDRLFGTL